jgi:aspartyl protease/tetratricopeptide repeat protein
MSSSPVPAILGIFAFSSLFLVPLGAQDSSISDLLLRDEIQQAENQLAKLPATANNTAFRGEIEFRKGHFEQAEAFYKEALKMDSKTARAHFGLGKLAMGKAKAKPAIEEFRRAVELDPKEPLYHLSFSEALGIDKKYGEQRKQLEEYLRLNPKDEDRVTEAKAALETLKAFGTEEVGAVEAPQSPAPIHFRKSLNLIFTTAMVNGKGPYQFAIDTGATQTVVSEKLAKEAGLETITSTVVFGIGGTGKVDTKLYKMKTFAVGDIRVKNSPVGTFNDPLISQIADGILGTSMFSDFIVNIDYPSSQMVLTRKSTPAPAGTEVLPVWFFSNLLLVPVEANGKRGNFIIDTGAVTTVLSHSTAAQLGVDEKTPGAKVDMGIAGVGGFEGVVLKVPNVTFKTRQNTEVFPQVVAIDLKEISKTIGTEVAGILGYDFFSDYKVTLDYNTTEMRLAK